MQNVPQVAVKPYPKFFTIFTTIVLFLLVVFIAQFLINKTNQSYLTPVNSEVEESGGLIGNKIAMVAPGIQIQEYGFPTHYPMNVSCWLQNVQTLVTKLIKYRTLVLK